MQEIVAHPLTSCPVTVNHTNSITFLLARTSLTMTMSVEVTMSLNRMLHAHLTPRTRNTAWRIRMNILPFRTWETILLSRNFNLWVQYTYFEFKLLKLILLYFWYNTRLSGLLSSRLVSSQNRFGIR